MRQPVRAARPSRARHTFVSLVLAVLWIMSCSSGGGTGGGCTALAPFPVGTHYVGPKNDNVVNIRLSPNGIGYLNNNWQMLVDAFAPGRKLQIPIPCSKQNFPVLGDVWVADQGAANCGNGCLDDTCDAKDQPALVNITITSFVLSPKQPNKLDATIGLTINTGKIYLANPHTICDIDCSLNYNAAKVGAASNDISATVQFSIDTKWDKMLAFTVQNINGTQVCGSSPSSSATCFDPGDLDLNGESFCGSVCDLADWAPVKNFVLGLISPMLQDQINAAVGSQSCWACDSASPCPTINGNTSTCTNKVCMDGAKCVPRFLGVEGQLGLGAFLGQFGAPDEAKLDMTVFAGSSVTVDNGLSFGTRGGLKAVTPAKCVVPQAAPPMVAVNAPPFDADAPAPHPTRGQYHAGLGISSPFINLAMHEAHQSGALCLGLTTANVGLINTGLFKTFLPSLGKLTTRDGKDAPMMVVLRPGRPPDVTIGLGTYDPVTKKPIKPLLLLNLPDLSIDFYAQLDDRYARLFTLTADISMPMSLIFEGCDKVTPALGDLKQLITNIRTANSEMLAEDPQVLADLVPAIVGLAEPALAGALKPFQLPTLGQFKLQVAAAKGVGNIAGSEAYNHLGIYAYLLPATAMCAVSAPQTRASLARSVMPGRDEMRLHGKKLPWPEAVLAVSATRKPGSPEFSYRVDDGLWTDFITDENGELTVSHPGFLLQGAHVIDVRSRVAEDPHGISEPMRVGFVSDWEPPELAVTVDRTGDALVLSARDVISPKASLQYAYAVGKGSFGEFGPERPISLSAVEAQGGVTVRVKDELGNVGELAWRAPMVALREDGVAAPAPALDVPPGGCSSVGGSGLLGLVALAGLLRRRRC